MYMVMAVLPAVKVSHYWCSEKHKLRIEEAVRSPWGFLCLVTGDSANSPYHLYMNSFPQCLLCTLPFS